MVFPVIPIVAAAAVGAALWKKSKKKGMTPERKKGFDAAIKTLKDPVKLRKLADAFEKDGLRAEATELRKRAAISSAPPATTQARKTVFKKAMNSKNPTAIKKTANEFHKKGYYESAQSLRRYAGGLMNFKKASTPSKSGISGSVKIGDEENSMFEGDNVPQSAAEV